MSQSKGKGFSSESSQQERNDEEKGMVAAYGVWFQDSLR